MHTQSAPRVHRSRRAETAATREIPDAGAISFVRAGRYFSLQRWRSFNKNAALQKSSDSCRAAYLSMRLFSFAPRFFAQSCDLAFRAEHDQCFQNISCALRPQRAPRTVKYIAAQHQFNVFRRRRIFRPQMGERAEFQAFGSCASANSFFSPFKTARTGTLSILPFVTLTYFSMSAARTSNGVASATIFL